MSTRPRLVVVGNGMVGQRFLESLSPGAAFSTTVIGEEPRPAYDRVQLSAFFSGKTAEDLSLVAADFFERNAITTHLAERAVAIDREARCVRTASGREVEYDTLVLATGSYPFVPPLPGRERAACHVYRTIEDLEAIRSSARDARVGAVIGGGLLGLEAAKALVDLGLETHVVEFAPRLMALQVDEGGGGMLRRKIEALGVRVHTGKNTREIVTGEVARHLMKFADDSSLETDIVVFSAGIRPRDDLARSAGLAVGERGGIVIDDICQTSDPRIYAIGECALWRGKLFGLVAPGYQMAQIVAARLSGSTAAVFAGADMSTKLKLLGVDVASIGDAHAATPGARSYSFVDGKRDLYKKLVVSADGSRLLGAVLVGDTDAYGACLQTMLNGLALPEFPEELILPQRPGGQTASGATGLAALPADAQICSCNNVSKGAICAAVEAGCTTIGALKTKTKAASSCGGCASLVTQILKSELERKGVAVDNHVCEHFAYSRQQLFHLVRVGELRSFDEVLSAHGRGLGCDICKP
ncbi:MAG TPA: nitrite reductase large subunit NirB, partial [Steroidobacteraceae bacterium]